MAIEVSGYTPNVDRWQQRRNGAHQGNNRVAADHAERQVFNNLPAATVYLLLQNAFPCHICHTYFLAQSVQGHATIIKVTANEGNYSADHGYGLNGSVPQILYYYQGNCKYVGLFSRNDSDPPNGFPAHPDFTDL